MDKPQKNQFVYVISEDFQVLYCNDEWRNINWETKKGRPCYEVICNEHSQCARCPLREENRGRGKVFCKLRNEWGSLREVPIVMPGEGRCHVMTFDMIEANEFHERNVLSGCFYDKKQFFAVVDDVLAKDADGVHRCIVALDIENLKMFNELYGRATGDALLADIFECLNREAEEVDGISGYFGNDDFAILMPYDEEEIKSLYSRICNLIDFYGNKTGFFPAFGIYEIKDKSEPAFTMYDRAGLARSTVKGNYGVRMRKFDMEILEKFESQYILYTDIQKGITNHEFFFVLQPKCNMRTGKIVGAEALVRWNSEEKGSISPGVFVPFLEKTGFISEMDLYVWEGVCKWQRSMLDRGLPTVPVSVNVSRVDIYSMGVSAYFCELIRKYRLSPELIEIELTESVYTEENEFISKSITDLRRAGFKVLMDDFGSGYSSLNMLKDIEIDILKMDMRFLELNQENSKKGIDILKTVFNMAKILGIGVIVEGVETEEQREILLEMGGDYGQGYYFYRPLPVAEFEEMIGETENVEAENLLCGEERVDGRGRM